MMVPVRSSLTSALLLFAAGALVACSGSKDEPPPTAKATVAAMATVAAKTTTTATVAPAGAPGASAATPAAAATTVSGGGSSAEVNLKEFSIAVEPGAVPAGELRFNVRNTGKVPHEIVILQTDVDPAKMPVKEGRIDEAQYKPVGAVRDVNGGATKTETFKLNPGKYVFICNIAGHPNAGMYTAVTVR